MLELANLSSSVLSNSYGYTSEQIGILKAYDGRDLSDYPAIRAVTSTLTGSIVSPEHSSTSITARLNWYWSTPPAFYSYEDVIGVRWQGINSSAQNISLSLDTSGSNSYAYVTYYSTGDYTTSEYTEYLSFLNTSPYSHTEVAFNRLSSSLLGYAKMGSVRVKVNVPSTTTAAISEASFIFAYGLTSSSNSYSIAFPASFSITFGTTTSQAMYKTVVIAPDGTITNY